VRKKKSWEKAEGKEVPVRGIKKKISRGVGTFVKTEQIKIDRKKLQGLGQ